jgi:hypothetical protein
VIKNGLTTQQLLLLFTLGHIFLALLELPHVMSRVLSAQHVFTRRQLLRLQRSYLNLFCQ